MARLIDHQQTKIKDLGRLYENLRKEPNPRRTLDRLTYYEGERAKLWEEIEKNHKELVDAGAPQEYEAKFEEAAILNSKFYEKIKLWISIKEVDSNILPIKSAEPTSSMHLQDQSTKLITSKIPEKTESQFPLTYRTQEVHVTFPSTKPKSSSAVFTSVATPISTQLTNSEFHNAHSANVHNQPIMSTQTLVNNQTSSVQQQSTSNSNVAYSTERNEAQISGGLSWNQQIDQELAQHANNPSSNMERILLMLTQNQLSQKKVKPPEINVPCFDGNIKTYRSFKMMFSKVVSNTSWDTDDLFIYLKSKLTGEALEVIENLEDTSQSYNIAWDLLERRYNNKRKLLEAIMRLLSDQKFKTQHGDSRSITTFVNVYQNVLANIRQLNVTIEDVIMELVLPRIDNESRGRFEDYIGLSLETPTFTQLNNFFEKEKIVWENRHPPNHKQKANQNATKAHLTNNTKKESAVECFICKKAHTVIECEVFLASNDREKLLRKNYVCIFCAEHKYDRRRPCKIKKDLYCEHCKVKGKHITLMHPLEVQEPCDEPEAETSAHVAQNLNDMCSVLPTAIATILDNNGQPHQVRCLVDICAEKSYVCEDIVQKLRLRKEKAKFKIFGVNGSTSKATSSVQLVIKVDDPSVENITTQALVVPKVTGMLPSTLVSAHLGHFDQKLADPHYNKPSFVGILLGNDVTSKIFKSGVPNHITKSGLLLQSTHFGWIVSGNAGNTSRYTSTFVTLNESIAKASNDEELTKRIILFYELPETVEDTRDEEVNYSERLYQEHHYRLDDGRYVVPTPWKTEAPQLGHSYRMAVRMFRGQEGKWLKNPKHYELSNRFMVEYEKLGHMTRIDPSEEKDDSNRVYYIPYLSILRQDSLTTKLRNVFNASMPSSNGVSLNDMMWEGPKLQTSIIDIVLKARSFKIMYAADISKMFRQILIKPEDRNKLRIIWRPSSFEPLREYRLNTVTYGTDAAPFLAIRTIHQCASDNAPSKEIENIIRNGFYVDDLVYGADTSEESQRQITEISTTLQAGKLPLTKWVSNCTETLECVPPNDTISSYLPEGVKTIKLLGIPYNYVEDEFFLDYKQPNEIKFTKRGISSAAASFYDPLGFILPFIMMLRIILQNVWKHKIDWDENIGEELTQQFQHCIKGLCSLNKIRIPRHVSFDSDNNITFIGFSDASNKAQAAVVYSRTKTSTGFKVTLVTAKGNVTKIKTKEVIESRQCTIPKLELQALVTLTELFSTLKKCYAHRNVKFIAYTDSQVVLAWVRSKKKIMNNYVEKRIQKIRTTLLPEDLHYVRSEENPADPASRGLSAEQLADNSMWFDGPEWLYYDVLPSTPIKDEDDTVALTTISINPEKDMFAKYSSWQKVLRIATYCLRWRKSIKINPITAEDYITSKVRVIKYYQRLHLDDVLKVLREGKQVHKRHWLYNLSPFLDNDELIRVGGRLGNADNITESQRHPIVIPKGRCIDFLLDFTHQQNGHASNTLMLRLLVEEYWIPGIKRAIKTHISKCVRCIRWNARVTQPEMSHLPKERVTPSSTFDKVGVDLSGPYSIKASPLRFDRTMKVWVVNFVCLVTKATHLEIVSSLSTEHFLAAFSRFCCRRGTSSEVWSDNGTNFVGANRHLRESWVKIVKDTEQRTAVQEVIWKFIPRHSPTFGGLWEACVKSMKFFVRRMADVRNLTFEEFETLLCRIEAILNSRPLCSNPLNPTDAPALTPFHFINQRGFKATAVDANMKLPLTKKWLMIIQIQHQFWERFRTEYLRELQRKVKWQKLKPNLAINDLVLLKEPTSTPGDWKMAKVTKTYPDPQGTVRKVDVITSTNERSLHAVNQLVPLLPDEEEESKLRRSQRSKSVTGISLVHLTLVVLLTLLPTNSAQLIEELSPGIHLKYIGEVYTKAVDLKFTVTTSVNLTDDISIMHTSMDEFNKECMKFQQTSPSIALQCTTLNSSIQQRADQIISEIVSSYNNKQKRWLGITAKGLWKAAPAILTTTGMMYQEAQIWNLRNDLAITQQKIMKMSNVLLQINDLEYDAVEGKLNEVIQKQQQLQIEETITEFAQRIELLFQKIKSKHDDIINIKPLKQLLDFVKPLQAQMPHIALPDFMEEIFSVYPAVKGKSSDLTTVTFTIPLVNIPQLTDWVIISVPTANLKSVKLSNRQKFQRLAVHPDMKRYAEITSKTFLFENLLDNLMLIPMDDCLQNILLNTSDLTKCALEDIRQEDDEVFTISQNTAIIFINAENGSTQIHCKDAIHLVTAGAAVFDSSLCISDDVTAVNTYPPEHDVTAVPDFFINELERDPRINELRANLKTEWWDISAYNSKELSSSVIGLLAAMIFGVIAVKCYYNHQQRQRWAPNWIGPPAPGNV